MINSRASSYQDLILWIFAGGPALLFALHPIHAALVNGVFIPADPDSFYHAHRILAAIAAPSGLMQFDPTIHVPEGSWIPWPWGYDMAMACIAHIAVTYFGVSQPLAVLDFVAPLYVLVNAALMVGITRELGLSLPLRAVALFCFAFSPLTLYLHRVGMLDHHYVEYSFALMTLLFGLMWMKQLENRGRALVLGVILGMAPAFHNGLFILQLPVLLTLALRWLFDGRIESRAIPWFGGALVLTTALFLLPSEPFRKFQFLYYLHSWFHLYISVCTAASAYLLSRLKRNARTCLLVAAISAVLLVPILGQATQGGKFLTGRLVDLDLLLEVKGVPGFLEEGNYRGVNSLYSGLVWLLPAGILGLLWQLRRNREGGRLYFAVMVVFGSCLMLLQFRLQYFGSFALYLPLCCLVKDYQSCHATRGKYVIGAFGLVVILAYGTVWPLLWKQWPPGGSNEYYLTMSIYPKMKEVCDRAPGVVLADSSDGHFITFHTKCSVIGDLLILTAQDEQKILEVDKLMHSTVKDVLREAPYVRYIYVNRNDNVLQSSCRASCLENKGLRQELLFDAPPYPEGLRLLANIDLKGRDSRPEPFMRFFEVIPKK